MINYKNIKIIINSTKKSINITGILGRFEKHLNGRALVYYNKKLFIITKVDYKIFCNLLNRLYVGVTYGYFIEINFVGLGYRFLKVKNFLLLKLGYSHYIKYVIPQSLYIVGYKRKLILYGMNIIEVNSVAKQLQLFKKPNIYKGKGIQIVGEVLKYKIGKQK